MSAKTLNLDHYWMPFTDNRYFKSHPRLFESAEGMYYRSSDGRQILDATAGLWCVNAGHCRQPITQAIQRQAGTLDFAPSFQLGHSGPFELAESLAAIMPSGLDRIFFTNSGSEAVETALKIALAYQKAIGQGHRTRLIGRERGYHGVNFGGLSVGGIGPNRRAFNSTLPGVDHLPTTYPTSGHFFLGQPPSNEDFAAVFEQRFQLHGAENIAAVIVEPVACSGGVLVPPKGYLEALRSITKKYGILLIFDEVITGFGRLGAPTASELFGITPDLITLAKGLTNATVPMGGVAVHRDIYNAIVNAALPGVELFHGYTYSGHPLASAAGIATLELYRSEELFNRAASLVPHWQDAVHSLKGTRHVTDIRSIGLVAGIDLASRTSFPGARGQDILRKCFDSGVLVRASGDFIALSPPLIMEHKQIDEIVTKLSEVLADTD